MSIMFSVLIPAYNRADYLYYTLLTCAQQQFSNVEFIIQDDCSTDNTYLVVNNFVLSDRRFKYFTNDSNKGMLQNFETGLNNCQGQYFICLGSDDGLMPGALERLEKILSSKKCDILTWPTSAFFYSGTKTIYPQLVLPHDMFKRKFLIKKRSLEFLNRQAKKVFYIGDNECPMLYIKSVVSRKLIEKVKSLSGGKFYCCSTPDGYSAFALASVSDFFIYTNDSFTIHGVSPNSAGLNYVQGGNVGGDLSDKFFSDSKSIPMSKSLGAADYSPLITLMTADFIYKTDEIFNHQISHKLNIRHVIKNSIMEVCDGLMADEKVTRELKIIKKIAIYHDCLEYFEELVRKTPRNSRRALNADAISPRLLYLNCDTRGISNLFLASVFVNKKLNSRKIYFQLNLFKTLANSLYYFILSFVPQKKINEYYSL